MSQTFEMFTHKTPNPRWGGLKIMYSFSRHFMPFPDFYFWPSTIPTATPWDGEVNLVTVNLFSFETVPRYIRMCVESWIYKQNITDIAKQRPMTWVFAASLLVTIPHAAWLTSRCHCSDCHCPPAKYPLRRMAPMSPPFRTIRGTIFFW